MKNLFYLLCLLLVSCLYEKNDNPNIILFMVDDLGWQDTSVPFWSQETEFNKLYNTPNMEKLAKMGVKFTNAYATPVCSPTRISLMTGMNSVNHRVTNWTLHPNVKKPAEINHEEFEFPDWNYNGLSTIAGINNTVYASSLPQILKDNGYYTIHAGKAHLGAISFPSADPSNIGFDINIAGHAAGAPQSYLGVENFGNGDKKNKIWAVPGLEKYHGQDIFLTEAITQEIFYSLNKPRQLSRPYFLYFSLYNVHTPLKEDKRFSEKYKDLGLHPAEVKYASMIESMDYALGSIMNNISENNELDNTVIIFMSDNGGLSAVARGGKKHTHNWPLKSGKGSIYEGGIRVPMIVYDPNAIFDGREIDKPLIIEDFFPSILDFANIDKYNTVQKIDGKSFKPILYNQDVDSKPLIWHYPNWWGPSGPGIGSYSAIRDGKWKLIYSHDKLELELYNLEEDIFEKNNLASENIKVTRQLSQKLTDYLMKNKAQMPLLKETGVKIDWPNSLLKN